MTTTTKRRCVECRRLVHEQSTPAEHKLSCSIGWSASATHIGTTPSEERLILAAIEFVARNNLVAGPLTRAVQAVRKERGDV